MSLFTPAEIDYVTSRPLGRLATVGTDGRPHVMRVGVFHDQDTDTLVTGSAADMPRSKKYRDARHDPNVAIVIDDLATVDPWAPRGIEVRGVAETMTDGGTELGRRLGAGFALAARDVA